MRANSAMFSEKLNPWMWPLKMLVPSIANARLPIDEANAFIAMEGDVSASISKALDSYRQMRDSASEQVFALWYGTD